MLIENFCMRLAKREFVSNNCVHRRPTHGKAAAPTRDLSLAAQAHDHPSTTVATPAGTATAANTAAKNGAATWHVPKSPFDRT